jgi:tRNA U34 5-methylaminomethyl-2-thiouridine-forming methyltransferase MnmC
MKLSVLLTKDGSMILCNNEFKTSYHSLRGAIQESRYVFLFRGLSYASEIFGNQLRVFEVGFGTGLNELLTAIACEDRRLSVHYNGLEKYPVDLKILSELNYIDMIGGRAETVFKKLHSAELNRRIELAPNFLLTKIKEDLLVADIPTSLHLVYFHAFAPTVSLELWTNKIFNKVYNAVMPGGVPVTFCANGEVKRSLKRCGFEIQTLPGSPGKTEMVRAIKGT